MKGSRRSIWLAGAMTTINSGGGFSGTGRGIQVQKVTRTESEMELFETTP
jgi:hypothetical protein